MPGLPYLTVMAERKKTFLEGREAMGFISHWADSLTNVDNSIKTVAVKIVALNVRIDDFDQGNTKHVLSELPQYLAECQSDKSALPEVINLFKNGWGRR